jgi:hypothetical protein
MPHTRDEVRQKLAERLCWEVARRDDRRGARRLYRTQVIDGVYRLDDGALLDAFFHDLEDVGVMALLTEVHGTARPRERVPCVHDVLRYSLKTRCGMESRQALPAWWCSDAALMPLVGVNAPQVRQGIGQRGATTRQGERVPGPICPATLATHLVKVHGRDLEAVFKGASRALARAGGFGAKVTGLVDGTELATTERSVGGGQVPRHVRQADQQGRVHESEVTV